MARRRRLRASGTWPVLPGSEKPPKNWPGWPNGRKFAFVLTHDVEGPQGLEQCRKLAELEMELGFRSSFNFVPKGEYVVPADLRGWLTANGFEVGVHDYQHDGKLYRSRDHFARGAEVINHHLKEWNAVGFRAGFMFHNLDWQRELQVSYDASTFDTDPFEPQPSGVGTIFPFWVPPSNGSQGYAELPYTLVQDSTLFFFLREPTISIWKEKLQWIARGGGMALLNVHPDYIDFSEGQGVRPGRYAASHYRQLLEFLRSSHEGQYWHVLPKAVAEFVSRNRKALPPPEPVAASLASGTTPRVKIWIDLDNTPHVPLFIPIIRELERRGHRVLLTARDAFQVCELARQKGLPFVKVGRHNGKSRIMKVLGLLWRSAQLAPHCLRERPQLALSHGSRSKELLGKALGIPTISMNDYEHSSMVPLAPPSWVIVPDAISREAAGGLPGHVRQYRGIKEDVYAPDFKPDDRLLDELRLRGAKLVVTVRPPATEAHYHNPEAEGLLEELMTRICSTEGARVVLLPRNRRQEHDLRAAHPEWFAGERTTVPARAVEGMNLLWFSDLVVSGGGTMNREAAALGVPVYSIFRGKPGAVDLKLEREGRLTMIRSIEDVRTLIQLQPRDKRGGPQNRPCHALMDVVNHVEEIIRIECIDLRANGGARVSR